MPSTIHTPPQTAYDGGQNVSAKDISQALEVLTTHPPTPPPSTGIDTPFTRPDAPLLQCIHTTSPCSSLAVGSAEQSGMTVEKESARSRQERYEEEWRVYLGLEESSERAPRHLEWEYVIETGKEGTQGREESERYEEEWEVYLGLG